ncbi:MAG: acyl-CoA dehydrogenase C-terminal domain-containing protein, partial [Parasphingopyxis sp.]
HADCSVVAERLAGAGAEDRLAASYPFLTMLATLTCGWLLANQARLAEGGDGEFLRMKHAACRFYLDQLLPEASGLNAAATADADILYAVDGAAFAA